VKFTRERAPASLRLTAAWFFFASSCRSAPVSEDDLSENRYLLFGLMVDRGRMSGAATPSHAITLFHEEKIDHF
jgi:hypothetical protein